MKNESSKKNIGEVRLIDLLRVLIVRKWWFIGTFIIIFIAGTLFSILRIPQYTLTSTLVISSVNPSHYENLMQLFPEKTGKLINVNHITESEKILSEDFLLEAKDKIDFDMDINELKDTIYIYTARDGILKLTTVYSDPEKTYEINRALFETYTDRRSNEISKAYKELLDEISVKMADISTEIEDLLDKPGNEDILINKEIELKYETFYVLEENKNILIENEDHFVERIKVSLNPDISNLYGYFNYKRDIAFSFFAAIAIGLIAAFAANYFQSLSKQNS